MSDIQNPVELVNALAEDIVAKRKVQLQSNKKRFIPRNFYASSIFLLRNQKQSFLLPNEEFLKHRVQEEFL